MPQVDWALFAQSCSIDRFSNSLSIFNIIEEIGIPPEVPEPPQDTAFQMNPSFVLLQIWSRTEAEPSLIHARVTVVAPNGREFARSEYTVNFEKTLRSRAINQVPGLPYVGPGEYKFLIDVREGEEWRRMTEHALSVKRLEAPPVQAAPQSGD